MKIVVYQNNDVIHEAVFSGNSVLIGRSVQNDIVLKHEYISKIHARITETEDGFIIEDMGSTNGTYIKDRKISSSEISSSKCEISIKPFLIVVSKEEEETDTIEIPAVGEEVVLENAEKSISLGVGKRLFPNVQKIIKKTTPANDFNLHFGLMIGETEQMKRVYELIKRVASQDSPVLILGETGTGKELVARSIHQLSKKPGLFVALNCATLGELLESELFGHLKGAFTGAYKDKKGKLAIAKGGTLLLDEVGEMPHDVQAKLLRVMQDRSFTPLGSEKEERTDARIIAATNQDITRLVNEGSIRLDFYHRIKVFDITIPPLRERKKDIPLLVDYYLKTLSQKIGFEETIQISKDAMSILINHTWQGNVRQLENTLEKTLLLLEEKKIIGEEDLAMEDEVLINIQPGILIKQSPSNLQDAEKDILIKVIKSTGGDLKETAKQLNVTLRTVYNYIKKHDIDIREILRS